MGSAITSLFGMQQKEPEIPEYRAEPVPVYEEAAEPEGKSAREAEQKRIRARRLPYASSLLSQPLGGGAGSSGGVLGRTLISG